MKIVIVGAGIMGLAVAWACRRRGHEVAVYEQGPVPNPLGSSVDEHRVIREAYGAEQGYARMAGAAFEAWEAMWADLGEALYHETGVLALDTGPESWARISAATLARAGIAHERLDRDAIAGRWPFLELDGIEGGLWCRRGGALLAGRIIELLAHHLGVNGAEIHAHARVAAMDPGRAAIRLDSGEAVHGDILVVAAGPWVARLVPDLGGRVTPSRQVLAYMAPPADLEVAWAQAPVLVDIDRAAGFYLVPPVADTPMKVGDHRFTLAGDPDRDREPAADEVARVYELCRGRFRDFDRYRLLEGKTCFYTATEDERFVVERLDDRLWVLSGFSGHGFKFGALIGLEVAKALDGERPAADVARWAAGRMTT